MLPLDITPWITLLILMISLWRIGVESWKVVVDAFVMRMLVLLNLDVVVEHFDCSGIFQNSMKMTLLGAKRSLWMVLLIDIPMSYTCSPFNPKEKDSLTNIR